MEGKIDAYRLKCFALVFMIIDHIHTYLYECYQVMPLWTGIVTRFVSPLFLYLMIDGFYHTRSRGKFFARLMGAAVIMQTGNILINYAFHKPNPISDGFSYYNLMMQGNNIFLTLALLFALIWCLEQIKLRNHAVLFGLLGLVVAGLSVFTEGGYVLLPITIVMWIFYGNKKKQCIGIAIVCLVFFAFALFAYKDFCNINGYCSLYSYLCLDNNWGIALVIPFIYLYNGERGKNTKFSKYLFYVIYPLHLWILYIMNYVGLFQ